MKNKTILIIEDSITYQQALRRAFIDQGYDCVCASTGREGLAKIESSIPDLIILDLILPGMSGREVCREIRLNIDCRHTPIMMLTMQREDKGVVEGLEAGADSYVNKNESLSLIVRRAQALIKLSAVVEPILKEESGIEEEKIEFKNKQILLVDDDITYLQAMKRGLEGVNYKVITASSGESCFKQLAEQLPDLILLDLRMPEIDGSDICRKIRNIRKFQHIPVVMLTASDTQEDVVRSFESGVTDYVIKSGDFKLIHLRVYSILRRKHFEEEAHRIQAKLTEAEKQTIAANAEKEAEKKYAQELAQKNEALNREMAIIAKMEEELKRSNRDLEQFAYAVSHDLQTPLRQMVGFSNLLSKIYRGKLDDKGDEFITSIANSGTRMQMLIQGLLQYSKIGKGGDEVKDVSAGDMVVNALKNLDILIKETNTQITYDNLPSLKVNEVAITQLFQNLIQNAIKYRHKDKTPLIAILSQDKGPEYEFSVKDNGIGIDPEHFTKIFEVFKRLHTDDQYSGIGLGLAMCEKYVKIHGGRIWVESTPGEGSTFKFTIPKFHSRL